MTKKDRRRKVTPEMKGRMRKLRDKGLTYRKISEKLDLSYTTVYNYLKEKEEEKGKVRFLERPARGIIPISIAAAVLIIAIVGYYLLTSKVEYETYANENYSFKFDYPADWVFSEYGYVFGAMENTPENVSGGYVMLLVLPLEADSTLDNVRDALTSHAENDENFTIIGGPADIIIDNIPAFRFSAATSAENITTRTVGVYSVRDNFLYSFSGRVREENYSDYEPIFEHVIDSFSFLEK
ncbi:MAG: PsbP-related protein [Candidatus Hadarchaeota archaeon]|nr:PsbP-related protein [Candidatus Hadarchaeota archaeon]